MGSCMSKGKDGAGGGKKRTKSTVSEANSSDADERAVRRTAQPPVETKPNGTAALPNMAQIKASRTPSPKPAAIQTQPQQQQQRRLNVSTGDAQTSAPAIATSFVPSAAAATTTATATAITTTTTTTTTAARGSNESGSAPVRSLSPTPVARPLSPASPSQLNSSPVASVGPAAVDRRADAITPPTQIPVAAAPSRKTAATPPPPPPTKTNGNAASPKTNGNSVEKRPASATVTAQMSMLDASLEHKSTPVERKTTPVERKTTPVELKTTPVVGTKAAVVAPSAIPVLRIETLAERRTASPVGSLNLERKITPADRSSAVTPPPPAPTPPPQAPTPPPMPPTPPPARGSMATISEDAPLPSPTKLTFGNGRRSGPPRGTFGYTFHTSGPPLGNSRPNSQGGSSPPHSPGEPNFGYFPASAPISRTASPAFGGASKSAPISRTASPAPVNEAQGGKSPDLTLGGMGRTTFGYSFDD